jgi:alcohol dehydrogenase
MRDFSFQTVADIRFSAQSLTTLGETLKAKFRCSRVLIVTDKGLRKVGITEKLSVPLIESGLQVSIFDQVVADPPEAVIEAAATYAEHADVVIGFGGGSSMDAAKLAAVLSCKEQKLQAMYGVEQVTSNRKPLVLIPTTAGTGSEVTPISIVTTGTSTKAGVVSSRLYADIAILDPSLLLNLPQKITAETGIDAMVHAIEAYTSNIKKNPISDHLAIKALSLLGNHLPGAYKEGSNIEHRSATMLGSMLAGQAFANAPVGAVHALAYPLGGIYHLPHGLTNALMLPHVLRFNLSHCASLYAELAPQRKEKHLVTDEEGALNFIKFMQSLCTDMGLNKSLREFDISYKALPKLAEEAMLQTRLLQNNPRPVTFDDALALYQQAW